MTVGNFHFQLDLIVDGRSLEVLHDFAFLELGERQMEAPIDVFKAEDSKQLAVDETSDGK